MKKIKKYLALFFLALSIPALFAQTPKTAKQTSNMDASSIDASSIDVGVPNPQVAMSVSYYPVTAGDVYTLGFAVGTTPVSYTLPVDSTYKIRVANLGVINCAGLTYLQLKSQVETLVLRNYPMGGVQFVLSAPSVFRITVTGEVKQTVDMNAWGLTRLSSVVEKCLTNYSSTRDIVIENADGHSKKYDIFRSTRKGELEQDPFLRPGDKIIVNRASRIVSISGAVERPGRYELLDGENLKELVEFYGNGLTLYADTSRIEVTRKVFGEKGSGNKSYMNQESLDANYELANFDSVFIASFTDTNPVVFVEGAVNPKLEEGTELVSSTRIPVAFLQGEDYAFFARRYKNWFTSISDLANAYVIRAGEVIPLNLNPILYDSDFYTKYEIQANDTLVIPFKQYFVSVAGAVAKPGRYPYLPDRTWDYYIGLAGGFVKSQNTLESVKITDINGKKLSKKTPITPECTITANTNSMLYYFNQYAPIVTTTLTAIVSAITVKTYLEKE